ncbi:hypothetical protein L596_021635 [Steinernema carpocapsae]|uniref:Uncharacterized protein n=1 Tax=Steinernema carpocapsae TaxID=34508 RepID=A0A4U5MJF2_STECR|nr:hypothetical protein L596_021635 [Steinernema carpocapsae]
MNGKDAVSDMRRECLDIKRNKRIKCIFTLYTKMSPPCTMSVEIVNATQAVLHETLREPTEVNVTQAAVGVMLWGQLRKNAEKKAEKEAGKERKKASKKPQGDILLSVFSLTEMKRLIGHIRGQIHRIQKKPQGDFDRRIVGALKAQKAFHEEEIEKWKEAEARKAAKDAKATKKAGTKAKKDTLAPTSKVILGFLVGVLGYN